MSACWVISLLHWFWMKRGEIDHLGSLRWVIILSLIEVIIGLVFIYLEFMFWKWFWLLLKFLGKIDLWLRILNNEILFPMFSFLFVWTFLISLAWNCLLIYKLLELFNLIKNFLLCFNQVWPIFFIRVTLIQTTISLTNWSWNFLTYRAKLWLRIRF